MHVMCMSVQRAGEEADKLHITRWVELVLGCVITDSTTLILGEFGFIVLRMCAVNTHTDNVFVLLFAVVSVLLPLVFLCQVCHKSLPPTCPPLAVPCRFYDVAMQSSPHDPTTRSVISSCYVCTTPHS